MEIFACFIVNKFKHCVPSSFTAYQTGDDARAGLYVGNAQGAAFASDAVTRYHLIDGYVIAPQAVIADISLLQTLPQRELRAGVYESIKALGFSLGMRFGQQGA